MSLTIVGSVAFDTLHTPEGTKEKIMGGSAVYAAIAASHFTRPSIVGVVGEDYHSQKIELLRSRGIDTSDIRKKFGKTFHWVGSYLEDINSAKTVDTEIGVLGRYQPEMTPQNAARQTLFLANNDPESQLFALKQSSATRIAMDTMNLWLNIKKEAVKEVVRHSHVLFINDAELRMLGDHYNLIQAAQTVMKWAPSLDVLVLKRGEHGASLFKRDGLYLSTGAFPLALVKDPTGAGDSFAGSFLGVLSDKEWTLENIKRALLIGSVTASFTVQEFGPDSLLAATPEKIELRYQELIKYFPL
jgi:sugar/nucleoside kinase (ribokinase family)